MTCAAERGGGVWCWGSNDHGQLGNGTTDASPVPARVSNLAGALTVSVGGTWTSGDLGAGLSAFACARLRDGTLDCWGNTDSWLGVDGGAPFSSVPLPVAGASGVTDIAAGNWHLCALAGGAVTCWGDDRYGQLGDGNQPTCFGGGCPTGTGDPLGPVRVTGLDNVAAIAAHGSDFTCALNADATVWCWGLLRGGTDSSASPTPVAIPGVMGSTTGLAVGFSHACAIPASGATI
jgi:alpha-tubulin suppressor-like RCC1 family protein